MGFIVLNLWVEGRDDQKPVASGEYELQSTRHAAGHNCALDANVAGLEAYLLKVDGPDFVDGDLLQLRLYVVLNFKSIEAQSRVSST